MNSLIYKEAVPVFSTRRSINPNNLENSIHHHEVHSSSLPGRPAGPVTCDSHSHSRFFLCAHSRLFLHGRGSHPRSRHLREPGGRIRAILPPLPAPVRSEDGRLLRPVPVLGVYCRQLQRQPVLAAWRQRLRQQGC
ncbi:hypothetical protein TOPH_02353 [Tolypocladium ophioglossoides CBS 100239]|uniref:Uncharacterized protein n=1 Tax=Tolypocladium ophioglossoides (strain CBS 100239) TaxID=1163406 RepID=A0A0L0NGW2_TOLOC|nr:hypothetical protein TOPH_02353 [Tolypocladium ophioglossoides CBS 100239]